MWSFLPDEALENWNEIRDIERLEECVVEFEKKFNNILNKPCTIKRVQIRNNYTPWLNNKIKTLQIQLENAKRKAINTNIKEDKANGH